MSVYNDSRHYGLQSSLPHEKPSQSWASEISAGIGLIIFLAIMVWGQPIVQAMFDHVAACRLPVHTSENCGG